jgi:hypothetical protein
MLIKIIAAIAAAAVVGSGVLYVLGGMGVPAGDGLPPEDNVDVVTEDFDGAGTLAGLMMHKKSMKCEFTDEQNGTMSEGTFYFDYKNERFRVDVKSIIDGEQFVTHMVNDGEKIYSWGTSMEKGIIMSADMNDFSDMSPFNNEGLEEDSTIGVDEDVEYNCKNWKANKSTFIPDASVEFVDMQAMMQEMLDGMPEGFDPEIIGNLENI